MNKRIFLAAVCAIAMGPVFAQTSKVEEKVEYSQDKYKVETNRFWSNWFISAGAGGQVYFGDHDKQAKLKDRISGAVDIAVGKWFTPGIGVRVMYSGWKLKGATQTKIHSTGEAVPGKENVWLEKSKFNFANFHGDVLFNLSNLLCGYKENRVWNFSPYVGLGWARVWEEPTSKEVSADLGFLNTFRLSSALDLNLDIRGTMVNDRFDGEDGHRPEDGMISATLGLTYKFKKRNWDKSKTVYRYEYGDVEAMRQKLNDMSAENERLKNALAEKNVPEARTIIKKIAAANLVTFMINKTQLTEEARVNLGMLAEVIKQGDKDAKYTITGYADKGTGSKDVNQRLSEKRAQAVYDCLVKEFGVDASQLSIDSKGGVDNMFYDDPRLSRAVITRCN